MSEVIEKQDGFRKECIYVNKVYEECVVVDCVTFRIPIPPTCPPAVNVVECVVTVNNAEGIVIRDGEVNFNINFNLDVEYDGNGMPQFIQQSNSFRRTRMRLDAAQVGMQVVLLPLLSCVACRIENDGAVIECDIGFYVIVKAVALVQLQVMGRFCPMPEDCEEVSAGDCDEWFADAAEGRFWPPFPPQPPVEPCPQPQRPRQRPRPPVF